MPTDNDIAREAQATVVRMFSGATFTPKKRKRAAPHRCIDCGRVTRHVRCHACMGVARCGPCGWVKK